MENIKTLLNMIEQQRKILRPIFNDSDIDIDIDCEISNKLWNHIMGNCCFENLLKYDYYKKHNQLKSFNFRFISNCCFENILSFIKNKNYNEIKLSLNELRKLIQEELHDLNNNNNYMELD